MEKQDSETRLRILQVALKRFAYAGYAGASVPGDGVRCESYQAYLILLL